MLHFSDETRALQNEETDETPQLDPDNLGSEPAPRECEFGLMQCNENEICTIPKGSKKRYGFCECEEGFVRDSTDRCVGDTKHSTKEVHTTTELSEVTPVTVTKSPGRVKDVTVSTTTTGKPWTHKVTSGPTTTTATTVKGKLG